MAEEKTSFQERLPDILTNAIGTMKFIYWATFAIALWIALNISGLTWLHWDPYPFVFLNLGFSAFAFYSAPLILMSQNRQSERDREKAAMDLATDIASLQILKSIAVKLEIPTEE